MLGSVVLPNTTAAEWPALRAAIRQRILATIGAPRPEFKPETPRFEEIERYEKHELTHVKVRYHVLDDEWNTGVIVFQGSEPKTAQPCVMTIHGTNGKVGKYSPLMAENNRRAYGIDLAQRGYVVFSCDQYGFGESVPEPDPKKYGPAFFEKWPEWSLDGRRLLGHTRALDFLQTLRYVSSAFGAMGISTGGRGVVYLAAFDERIAAAVPACGISPNCSNVFRSIAWDYMLSPKLNEPIKKNGQVPWDYHEMLALVAPRALLALEPFNDNCNPDVFPTLECLYRAAEVYRLLGAAERLAFLTHGDGHDTVPDVKELAYRWLDRFLRG